MKSARQTSHIKLNAVMHFVSCCATKIKHFPSLQHPFSLLRSVQPSKFAPCTEYVPLLFQVLQGVTLKSSWNKSCQTLRIRHFVIPTYQCFCGRGKIASKGNSLFSFPVLTTQNKTSSSSPVLLNMEKSILLGHLPVLSSV